MFDINKLTFASSQEFYTFLAELYLSPACAYLRRATLLQIQKRLEVVLTRSRPAMDRLWEDRVLVANLMGAAFTRSTPKYIFFAGEYFAFWKEGPKWWIRSHRPVSFVECDQEFLPGLGSMIAELLVLIWALEDATDRSNRRKE